MFWSWMSRISSHPWVVVFSLFIWCKKKTPTKFLWLSWLMVMLIMMMMIMMIMVIRWQNLNKNNVFDFSNWRHPNVISFFLLLLLCFLSLGKMTRRPDNNGSLLCKKKNIFFLFYLWSVIGWDKQFFFLSFLAILKRNKAKYRKYCFFF